MTKTNIAKNYSELEKLYPLKRHIRSFIRDMYIFSLSTFSKTDSSKEWIRFPFYHHVFNDEKSGFKRHLKYFKNHGDFISIDRAVEIFEKKEKIGGRYFCITFDDGFKNCVSNALPILVENECPAAFFIPSDYIGCDINKDGDILQKFFAASADDLPIPVEFLSWNDCRKLHEAGMTIGSHTCTHVSPAKLNKEQLKSELIRSKQKIEEELRIDCHHFCCPWGQPGKHFKVGIDSLIAKEAGYRSFFTTERGPNFKGTDPLRIKRDHMLAKWRNYQLRYFFSDQR